MPVPERASSLKSRTSILSSSYISRRLGNNDTAGSDRRRRSDISGRGSIHRRNAAVRQSKDGLNRVRRPESMNRSRSRSRSQSRSRSRSRSGSRSQPRPRSQSRSKSQPRGRLEDRSSSQYRRASTSRQRSSRSVVERSSSMAAAKTRNRELEMSVLDRTLATATAMIGDWVWKYVARKPRLGLRAGYASSSNYVGTAKGFWHRRWVWVSPPDGTIRWSRDNPEEWNFWALQFPTRSCQCDAFVLFPVHSRTALSGVFRFVLDTLGC
jgi:hypothetical protein